MSLAVLGSQRMRFAWTEISRVRSSLRAARIALQMLRISLSLGLERGLNDKSPLQLSMPAGQYSQLRNNFTSNFLPFILD